MVAIGIDLALESRRVRSQPPPQEEPGSPSLPSGWRGAATFDAGVQDEYDAWTGAPADFLWMTTGHDSWASFDAGFANALADFAGDSRPMVWSLPLSVNGTTLAEIAAGDFDAHFTAAAEAMLMAAPDDNTAIIVRLGWRANFEGLLPWAATGVESDYIAAWRRVHGLLRAVSNRFSFDWCLNSTQHSNSYDPSTYYPGDGYTDVISVVIYYHPSYANGPDELPTNYDPILLWNYVKELPFGPDWIAAFAASHEKPMAVSEWAIGWEKPQWMELAANWIESLSGLAYHAVSDNGPTRISDGSKGLAGHAYLMHFGTDVPAYGAAAIAGAVPGVLHSGGSLPTGWGSSGSYGTVEVLGTDVVDGVACLRLRIATAGSTESLPLFYVFAPMAWPGAPAEQGEQWRAAVAMKLEAQSGSGINNLFIELNEVDSGGEWLTANGVYDPPETYNSFPLYADHHTHMRKLSHEDAAAVVATPGVVFDLSGVPASADVLIAAPVLMRGPAVT